MVENFTTDEQDAYVDDTYDLEQSLNNDFELKIKKHLNNVLKGPNDKTIEEIMKYSKSFRTS